MQPNEMPWSTPDRAAGSRKKGPVGWVTALSVIYILLTIFMGIVGGWVGFFAALLVTILLALSISGKSDNLLLAAVVCALVLSIFLVVEFSYVLSLAANAAKEYKLHTYYISPEDWHAVLRALICAAVGDGLGFIAIILSVICLVKTKKNRVRPDTSPV